MSDIDLSTWKNWIVGLSQRDCALLHRFAPSGHMVFKQSVLAQLFLSHFNHIGGMTAAISKEIGWDAPRELPSPLA